MTTASKGTSPAEEVRTFLRWAGSKRQLIPSLKPLWGEDRKRYIEPFAGSAALFFALNPPKAILGDLNSELVETLSSVRNRPTQVHQALASLRKGKRHYYRIRAEDPQKLTTPQRAARFIYLNRYCFNGIFRTNKKGKFNVPYGAYKSGALPDLNHLKECGRRLRRATLMAGSFTRTLAHVRKGDFVYLDPPYAVNNTRVFVEYSKKPFSSVDLKTLEKWLKRIDDRGAHFVLSYIYCKETAKMFKRWERRRVTTKRMVAGMTSSRGPRYELRVTNIN